LDRAVPAENNKTAFLFGASRGLGLGLAKEYLARGWRVIATARDNAAQLEALKAPPDRLRIERIDIADTDGVAALAERLKGETLDLLFLVAGVSGSVPKPLHQVSADEAARVYLTNTYYPIVAAEALSGLLKPGGVVAFMSSMLGSITQNVGRTDWETYRTSKAGLNMASRSFFNRHNSHPVLAIAPGWVRTDMGGPSATFDVETSCRNVANAIEKHAAKPGHRYVNHDGSELPW
jgi:NAD(P)-dependent dehydrogenase (short-subunit alcohol dehydrogenase family)